MGAAAANALTDRRWRSEDLYRIRVPNSVQMSPDGSTIAFTKTWIPKGEYEYKHNIWLVDSKGKREPWQLTKGWEDGEARWSPDGKRIAFVRPVRRGSDYGALEVFTVKSNGEDLLQITDYEDGGYDPVWSPDGRHLLVTVNQHDVDDKVAWEAQKTDDPLPAMRVIKAPYFRLDDDSLDGFTYDWRAHVWLVDLKTGKTRQLTDSKTSEFGATWSPDGTKVAFLRDGLDDKKQWTSDIWVLDLATGNERKVTDGTIDAGAAIWSPDGSKVAFTGYRHRMAEGHGDVYVVSSDGGTARCLTAGKRFTTGDDCLDDMRSHSSIELSWTPDGSAVVAPVSRKGTTQLVRLNVEGHAAATFLTEDDQHVYSASPSADGKRMALAISDDETPGDLWVLTQTTPGVPDPEKDTLTSVSALNRNFYHERDSAGLEELSVVAKDGTRIQAWIMRARNSAEEKAPTVVSVHGGPACMYGHSFMLEFQLMAARGYNVVFCNPRGSTGYGRKFSGAVYGDVGGEDYQDIMAAVDAAIASGGVDADRLAISGGSYGGFMANWAIGHTQRFKVAIADRSLSDLASSYGTSDCGPMWAEEYGGTPSEIKEWYTAHSPITYVDKMTASQLFVHGEVDHRCAISQAEELFTRRVVLGHDVEFARFEGQSHELSRSGHSRLRVMRYDKMLDYLDAKLKPKLLDTAGAAEAKTPSRSKVRGHAGSHQPRPHHLPAARVGRPLRHPGAELV